MIYQKDEIDHIRLQIQELFKISSKLEKTFPDRKFTLDGHLIGSIGEVLAAYYYDLLLLPSSAEKHDATAPDGRKVQVKATQGTKSIALRSEPDYLIVLWIDDNTGDVREVNNGPGAIVWNACGKWASNGTRSITMSKLKKIAPQVSLEDKIDLANPILAELCPAAKGSRP